MATAVEQNALQRR